LEEQSALVCKIGWVTEKDELRDQPTIYSL
jgi:hypothetical protein